MRSSALLLTLVPCTALRSGAVQMAMSARVKGMNFETATPGTLAEVASFFVDSFWLASTTFEGIQLSDTDKKQLTQKVADDLGPRYGIASNDKRPTMMGGRRGFPSKSLFETRLIVAREPGGAIVGCSGIEAALYDASIGQVLRSGQADDAVRAELNAMDDEEAEAASEVYSANGIGGLAKGIIKDEFKAVLLQPYMATFVPCSLLANLAVAPEYRGEGLGRALCDKCVQCTTDEWSIDEIALQVEESNTIAVGLYEKEGYKAVFSAESYALRLQPSEPTKFSGLPGPFSALAGAFAPENEKLLKEVSSPTLTMSKMLS